MPNIHIHRKNISKFTSRYSLGLMDCRSKRELEFELINYFYDRYLLYNLVYFNHKRYILCNVYKKPLWEYYSSPVVFAKPLWEYHSSSPDFSDFPLYSSAFVFTFSYDGIEYLAFYYSFD